MLNKLWRILASHTLALWILAIMTLAVLAAGSLPQSARLSPEQQVGWQMQWERTASWLDTLGLSQIVGSWWFTALCIALLVNMTAGILTSLGRKLDFYKGRSRPSYELQGTGAVPEDLPPLLRRVPSETGSMARVCGVVGLFAPALFHLGLAVIVLAGFWRGAIDFTDFVELSVGEVFSAQPHKFQRRQAPPETFDAVLRLDGADITVRDGKYLGEFAGYFTYQYKGGPIEQAKVVSNHPLRLGDFEIHPKSEFGHSAWFERLTKDGRMSVMYIHFTVERQDWDKPWSGTKEQTLRIDGIPLDYTVTLHNTVPPIFDLKVVQDDRVLFDGRLRPGDVADLGVYKLRFMDMVPWMTFNIALDKGVWPVFTGFIITLVGFLLYLLIWPRRVELVATEQGWTARAWARRGDLAFEKRWADWSRQQDREPA